MPATPTVVPVSDEPELPIPSPAATQPAIALVRDDVVSEETVIPSTPLGQTVIEPVAATKPALPPTNPLATIIALSEAERIALFT